MSKRFIIFPDPNPYYDMAPVMDSRVELKTKSDLFFSMKNILEYFLQDEKRINILYAFVYLLFTAKNDTNVSNFRSDPDPFFKIDPEDPDQFQNENLV